MNLATFNRVFETEYKSWDDIPTPKLQRIYLLLRILEVMDTLGMTGRGKVVEEAVDDRD